MRKLKVGSFVFDFSIYPRVEIDTQHVSYMVETLSAGGNLPPPVVEKKSLRLIDGFHRTRAWIKAYGEDYEIDTIEKTYKTEGDLFADAMRFNASHGRALTRYDRVHCMLIAENLNLPMTDVAQALQMTTEKLGNLHDRRVAVGGRKQRQPVALKRSIEHMAGKHLTQIQVDAIDKLSGMQIAFHANQILLAIEHDFIDRAHEPTLTVLRKLRDALADFPF